MSDVRNIVRVQLFAAARDIAGREVVELEIVRPTEIATLRKQLLEMVPGLQPPANALLWAVNNEYVRDDRVVGPSDAVACFPPVSGG